MIKFITLSDILYIFRKSIIIIIISFFCTPSEFFPPAFIDGLSFEFDLQHVSLDFLNSSKNPSFNSFEFWISSILPLISSSTNLFSNFLGTVFEEHQQQLVSPSPLWITTFSAFC